MEWKDEWLEEGIPTFVIDEFAMGDESLKPGERPELLCPKCSGTMVFKDDKSENGK